MRRSSNLLKVLLCLLNGSSSAFLIPNIRLRAGLGLKADIGEGGSSSADDPTRPDYEIEPLPIRIGHGYDIHRLSPIQTAGQPLIIAGVEITHEPQKYLDRTGEYTGTPNTIYPTILGCEAHSDGDVVYHSLVDSIFGALTLPDIGQVFKDTDPRWRGVNSQQFMEYAEEVMTRYGYVIGNIDVTLILERPKVAGFKPEMKENIVRLLKTTPGKVNVKARTHEGVDSTGELRAVECHVVLTL
ncbi:hypothetical protein TL16_g03261, partial [Triparma laevis f. inornata]